MRTHDLPGDLGNETTGTKIITFVPVMQLYTSSFYSFVRAVRPNSNDEYNT